MTTVNDRQESRMGSSSLDASDTNNETVDRGWEWARRTPQVNGVREFRVYGSKEKVRGRFYWVCSNCGHTYGQFWRTCQACRKWGTLIKSFDFEEVKEGGSSKMTGNRASENALQSSLPKKSGDDRPMSITDVSQGLNHSEWMIPLHGEFGNELSRVLGGGLAPGCLVLIGGDPGVGKSTLLLQIGAMIAYRHDHGNPAPVVYVSGEENVEQICSRGNRISIETKHLYLYSSTDIKDIIDKTQSLSPRALIVDSIQTMHTNDVTGSAGGIQQVKECTSALQRFAKKTKIPVILIGHVTKSGDIAGPKMLEHIVDVVLYLEVEKSSSHRLLRSVKNRFGSTDELGVFEMLQTGLQPVSNPSEIFLRDQHQPNSEVLAGSAVAVLMDGSRSFLVKIQALCLSSCSIPRQGISIETLTSRVSNIITVLVKQAGMKLHDTTILVNVVSGVKLKETASDLAVAAAICSSHLEIPIPNGFAFIGEIDLGGRLIMVPAMEKRVNTVAKLGYRTCIVPKSAEKVLEASVIENVTVIGCRNLKEVINTVFKLKEMKH